MWHGAVSMRITLNNTTPENFDAGHQAVPWLRRQIPPHILPACGRQAACSAGTRLPPPPVCYQAVRQMGVCDYIVPMA